MLCVSAITSIRIKIEDMRASAGWYYAVHDEHEHTCAHSCAQSFVHTRRIGRTEQVDK